MSVAASMVEIPIPTNAALMAARRRIAGHIFETPLLESEALNERVGGRVLLKAEALQRTGSFKMRGAASKVTALREAGSLAAVVAYSSGNHGQAVARAAARAGIAATIVMPSDAPLGKRAATQAQGATVVLYDRATENREAIAGRIAALTGAAIIPPYDDPDVIAGQASCGAEIAEQCARIGVAPDQVLVCCGGGGLTAGIALALADAQPAALVHPVEPAGFDDWARSLASGRRERNPAATGSLCDALLTPEPGHLTFAINRGRVGQGFAVTDDEALQAMAFAFRHLKLVLEPGGAVALAALLSGRCAGRDRISVAVLSGGNVDPAVFARALALVE